MKVIYRFLNWGLTLNIGWYYFGCVSIVLALNAVLGRLSINYILTSFDYQPVGGVMSFVAGMFLGQFTIPLALLVWVARAGGIL